NAPPHEIESDIRSRASYGKPSTLDKFPAADLQEESRTATERRQCGAGGGGLWYHYAIFQGGTGMLWGGRNIGCRSGTATMHHRWHRAVTPTLAWALLDLVQRAYGVQRRRAWRMVSGGIGWGLCLIAASAGLGQAEVLQATLDNGLTVLIEE